MNGSQDLFAHGGDMGARMRALDWAATGLGPVESWPQSLKTCVRIILTSQQPMFVWWGDHLINLYNDAYRAILGGKHPDALGKPASYVWREIWDQIGPRAESAMRGNEGTYDEALLLIMERHGYQEETYYTFSYSPVPNDQGGTGGILCANTDDTHRIQGARQLATLQELAAQTADARTRSDACARGADALRGNPRDLPFALLYVRDPERHTLVLGGAAGLERGAPGAPAEIDPDGDAVWPLGEVLRSGAGEVVSDLVTKLPGLAAGALDRPPAQAALLPITAQGDKGVAGVLVVGLNPYRGYEGGYRGFLDLVAGQISAGLANAEEYEQEKRRNQALAELDRAKTTFFSNVSHEFRTPLTLMLGPLDDAVASPAAALAGDELSMVHRNALRLLKLVNTLLDFARIEAGRAHASYEPTDLATLTTDLASTFRSGVTKGGLLFEVVCPPLPEPVWVDREMWEKIVLNLISNAFKFTFEGRIGVTLRAEGERVELAVSDTGVGIPAHELSHVFERFHRIEGTRARTHEGSGIGLALVRDLVRLHGGDIRIESELGKGTTLTVSIPRGTAHLPPEHVSGPRPSTRTAARKEAYREEAMLWLSGDQPEGLLPKLPASAAHIVVVDDNADMRGYVTRLLRQRWHVEATANGVAALEAARRTRPDLVLTDAMMPEMDGFELVRELRADPRTKAVPIIMLSARAGEDATAEGLRAGADDYLVKPFSASSLMARVESQLASSRVRMEARQAAEEERKRLYALFMDGPAALAIIRGPELVIELANRTILEAWGKSEAVTGEPLMTAVPELAGQGFDTLLREVMRTGTSHRAQASQVRLDRGRRGALEDVYFDFVYTPVRDDDGRIDGVLIFAFEVTQQVIARRAAEAARSEAERAKAQAESATRAKDEFLAMLGHELRNPLAPILTALELMRAGDTGSDELSRVVIERQVGHLVRLIDDLLDVSRIARGKVELKREVVELSVVVAKAMEMASPLLEHSLTVTVPREGLAVEGDVTRLAQVVANLLTNAFKYTERGGRVTVTGAREGGQVVLSVTDSGIGIAPEMLPHIFDMFVQERQTIERSHGGLGLGLAIVRNLVDAHGGSVKAESAGKGQGSTFSVRLPAASAVVAPKPPSTPPPAAAPPARKLRVLLVDDNADAATLLGIFLRRLGHTIEVAHDGLSALGVAASFAPDVALLDIGLPVMDGYELARRLRGQPETAALRLVAVTGYGQDTDRELSRAAGFDRHLVKPVDRALLQQVLDGFAKEREQPPEQ